MSRHTSEQDQFYLTAPAPCPYLEGQMERKIFTHLAGSRAKENYNALAQAGFRRSQHVAYRPACQGCSACEPTRIIVGRFAPSKSQKRVMRRNADILGQEVQNRATSEQYALFRDYIEMRHRDGGMLDMSALDYAMMVEESAVNTAIVEYRARDADSAITGKSNGPLLAVALTDTMRDGPSLVYSFFAPDMSHRSLGTFIILDHIERARKQGLPYCHLGFYVSGSPKMEYKAMFTPQERLTAEGWVECG